MSIIHVRQIKSHLLSLFEGLLDISDIINLAESDKEAAFLSRALAGFALMAGANIVVDSAAPCVTDGGHDNGIDAIYFDELERVLYLVQSKWKADGNGSLDSGEAQKFVQGIRDLIAVRFERFNRKIQDRASEITDALCSAETRIVLLIAYTGQQPLSVEAQRVFNDLLEEMNDPTNVLQLRVFRQGDLHGIIASGTLGAPVSFDVVLANWGQIRDPFPAYYGQVAANEVASWWEQHHPRLFAPNLRMFLGDTDVNTSLMETLSVDPQNFWYFNNGITALCGSIKKKPLGGNTHETGIFECSDVTIVNGAQTVGAIALANSKSPDRVAEATVMVRFISLEQCPPGFAKLVTRATNTQNRIERRDFVSLDYEQERLRTELQLEGIDYVYKSGDRPRDINSGFDINEATIALACSHPDINYAVQAKGAIGKLWEDIEKAPYNSSFR